MKLVLIFGSLASPFLTAFPAPSRLIARLQLPTRIASPPVGKASPSQSPVSNVRSLIEGGAGHPCVLFLVASHALVRRAITPSSAGRFPRRYR
jgi:hypothetical protein